jgi:hypothetical protein
MPNVPTFIINSLISAGMNANLGGMSFLFVKVLFFA